MTEKEEDEVINCLNHKYWESLKRVQECDDLIKSTPYMDLVLRDSMRVERMVNKIRAIACSEALIKYALSNKQLTQLIKPYGIFQKN